MSLPPFPTLFNQLISTPTISATDATLDQSNQTLINQLANWFSELGFSVQIDAVPQSRHKFNLLAKYGEGDGGLLLCGHTDTVPFDAGQWCRDPFKVTEHDNKLYGLGSADMKGFFAFVLDAIRDIKQQKLTKPLYVLATADEETTMAGAIYFAKHAQLKPDCAIIGEPTSLIPIRAHKGHMANSIKIIGKSGHSSDPSQGINAIELMQLVINKLLQFREQLKEQYHNSSFAIPYPTLNLGSIHGGDAANRICGCCELVMDIRPLPEMDMDELYQRLCDLLAPISIEWPGRLTVSYETPPIPGYECRQHNPALQTVEKLVGKVAQTVNYSTEAPYINQFAPTIILGPGSIEQAHQPDEFLDCDFIEPTQQLLKRLINQFCR